MLVSDLRIIGNRLLAIRKRAGFTQAEAAELAGLSDRTYADIERGTVNMRLETLMGICRALHVTPDDLLTDYDRQTTVQKADILARLDACAPKDQQTALQLLETFLRSLDT